MGLGRFGGGLGVTRWLAAQGAEVVVTDLEPEERLRESVAALRPMVESGAVRLRLGGHNVSDFTACDLVVANPAVPRPWDNRFLRSARAAKIPITTEIELVAESLDRGRVIGVTGSMGKSTTAALIAHVLRECGQAVVLGGNIGGSLLEEVAKWRSGGVAEWKQPWIVLELSSAMLYWLHAWSPHVAVVTNIADNHKDWHGSFEHYAASKRVILDSQEPGDVAVLGAGVAEWGTRPGVKRVIVGAPEGWLSLRIPGEHNQRNAAMALAAVGALGIEGLEPAGARDAAAGFGGLPHRLEFAGEFGGVRYFNDSKATTAEATILALDALGLARPGEMHLPGVDIHLIAGGYDKGADLSPMRARAAGCAGLYFIGATGAGLAAAAKAARPGQHVEDCGTLERAVRAAAVRARPGDVVLLSPACASWDQFENYEQRGAEFCRLVRRYANAVVDTPRVTAHAPPRVRSGGSAT